MIGIYSIKTDAEAYGGHTMYLHTWIVAYKTGRHIITTKYESKWHCFNKASTSRLNNKVYNKIKKNYNN